jgi:polar amino acid transport system substrate-binding protein
MIPSRFFAFFFILNLWSASAVAQVCNTLVITGPPNAPPSSWTVDQRLVGASVDFVVKLALQSGVKKVETKVYDTWAQALNATQLGEVDLIFSAAVTEERKRFLNYVYPPYAGQNLYVIVRKGENFRLLKYEDLLGRRGAVGQGEAFGGDSKFGEFVAKNLSLTRTSSLSQSLELLFEGKVDYVLAYENSAESAIFVNNLAAKIDILTTYPFHAESYIAFSKRSKCSNALLPLFSSGVVNSKISNLFHNLTAENKSIFYESILASVLKAEKK